MSSWYRSGVCSNNAPARTPRRQSRQKTGRTGTLARRGIGAFAACCGMGLGVSVLAQQTQERVPPGMTATLDITQRLEYSDNPDLEVDKDSDLFGRTQLAFGLESETSVEVFGLSLGTDIEEGRDDRSSVDVTNSFFTLGYDRDVRQSRVGVALRYRESDVSSTFLAEDFDTDGRIIDQSDGTRQSYGISLTGAVGVEAPVGAEFSLDYDELTYSDTDDPDLTDRSTFDFEGRINFRLDPRITARLTAKYIDFDAQGNGTSRETTGFGSGVSLDISPLLTADVDLSYDSIERSGNETGTDDGFSASAGLTRTLTNGTLGFTLRSEVSSNADGRRNYVSLDRALDLSPRAALSYELGGTRSETSSFEPLVNVDYAYDLPSSRITFGLAQRVNTDRDNEEQINTTLNAGYEYQINSLSSLGATLSLFDRNEIGPDAVDGRRVNVSLSYQHALTRDWGLVGGVSHILSTSDDEADRSSNTIFVGLQRNFTWKP